MLCLEHIELGVVNNIFGCSKASARSQYQACGHSNQSIHFQILLSLALQE
jgi:hypothetical protein